MRDDIDPRAEEEPGIDERLEDATTSMHEVAELVREAMQRITALDERLGAMPGPDDLQLLRGQVRAAMREEREASEQRLLQTQQAVNSLASKVSAVNGSVAPLRDAIEKVSGQLERSVKQVGDRVEKSSAQTGEQLAQARARIDSLAKELASSVGSLRLELSSAAERRPSQLAALGERIDASAASTTEHLARLEAKIDRERDAAHLENVERLSAIAHEVRESLGGLEAIWGRLDVLEAAVHAKADGRQIAAPDASPAAISPAKARSEKKISQTPARPSAAKQRARTSARGAKTARTTRAKRTTTRAAKTSRAKPARARTSRAR